MLEVKNLSFSYRIDSREYEILKDLNFTINRGDFVAIQGPSGSGKSTLFYILGFLLKPTQGEVLFDGIEMTKLSEDELAVIRNRRIGFVFQQFHLLAKTSILENILLPTRYPTEIASSSPEYELKAKELAEKLGIQDHLLHNPNQLSGGQQQRAAIARALMHDVQLILADEPTGNLDSRNAKQTLELLKELNLQGKTIVLITHDSEVAKHCSKVFHFKDGSFTSIEENYKVDSGSEKTESVFARKFSIPKKISFLNYSKLLRATFPLVLANLLRNKAKSILTMLGVIIGVSAVLAMVTLGKYTEKKILESYESLGVNKILIWGWQNWNLRATDAVGSNFQSFRWEQDIIPLKKIFPEIQNFSPVMESYNNNATAGGLSIPDHITVMGVTHEYLTITNRRLRFGRNLNPFHIESRHPVCVVGFEIVERLYAHSNPIGQILTVSDGQRSSFPCQIIGVMEPITSNQGWAPPNKQIFIPYTYFETVNSNWWAGQIHQVAIQLHSGSDVEPSGKKIKAFFERKYGKSGIFNVDSDSTLIAQMKRFLKLFTVLLTAIALLSLAVGGIGINNMMLVSVTERIKEFGLRKALGATHRSIRIQVLMESVTLCALAGLIGAILGFSAYELMIFGASKFVPNLKFEWIFEPIALTLSVSSILAVGIISGLIPALRAEKLQVIEALRAE